MELSLLQTWGVGLCKVTIFSVQITTLIPLGLSLSCWVLGGRPGCHHSSQGVFLAVLYLLTHLSASGDEDNSWHFFCPSFPFGWFCKNVFYPSKCFSIELLWQTCRKTLIHWVVCCIVIIESSTVNLKGLRWVHIYSIYTSCQLSYFWHVSRICIAGKVLTKSIGYESKYFVNRFHSKWKSVPKLGQSFKSSQHKQHCNLSLISEIKPKYVKHSDNFFYF